MNLMTESGPDALVVRVHEERIDAAVAIQFKDKMRDIATGGRVILDLHAISTTDHERAHGCFYGRVQNSGQNLRFSLYGDLAIDFEEDARGS